MERYDCVIVGAGPAGIFCALELVRSGKDISILILEKGRDLKDRICPSREKRAPCFGCKPCAIVSGWGGAGAFSDGKLALSTEVGGMLGSYLDREEFEEGIRSVHEIYLEFGAPKEIYGLENQDEIDALAKRATLAGLRLVPAPVRHLGTGRTQQILQKMKDYLLAKGVAIRTNTPVESLLVRDGAVCGVLTSG
ncbi:MAG: NAD(P)-binding protein, partial [Thermacetogeniaceae bacterium]